MIGEADKYRELVERYRQYGDVELLELAASKDDLTEAAQEVLKGEMSARNLSLPKAAPAKRREIGVAEANSDEGESVSLREFAALAPDECVWEFADEEDARAASRALDASQIDSVVLQSGAGVRYGDTRPPRLVVRPEDVERAGMILSQPIAAEFRDKSAEVDTYVEPVCPACGAAEPLLESVDPVNEWSCEACGHTWVDAVQE